LRSIGLTRHGAARVLILAAGPDPAQTQSRT
jgi:hypothetical protein